MKFSNVIFDLDGTLIDSSDGVVEAVNYSLRMVGEPEQPPERIKSFIGYPLSQMYPHFSSAPTKELYSHFQIKASETVVSSTVALPEAVMVLEQLAQWGIKTSVATTKIKHHVDGIMVKLGWTRYFSTWCGGDEVKRVKPEPDIFHLVLEKMNANPSETLVIGDTINDVKAAQSVPVKVAAVFSPYGGRQELIDSKPDHLLESLRQLLEIVNPRETEKDVQ